MTSIWDERYEHPRYEWEDEIIQKKHREENLRQSDIKADDLDDALSDF